MRDLGTFPGKNHPGALDSYPKTARDLNAAFIGLVVIVAAIFAISYHTLPRVERAYQMEKV